MISNNGMRSITALLIAAGAFAQQDQGRPAGELVFLDGHVTVGGGAATLDLPADCRYLDEHNARFVIEQLWGNPVEEGTCGLVLPVGELPHEPSWAIVIGHVAKGHVVADATALDAEGALAAVRADASRRSSNRSASVHPSLTVLGWQRAPSYEPASHLLSWATRLAFAGDSEPTVNLHHRLLGRTEQLEFTTLTHGGLSAADARRSAAVVAGARFAAGHRYEDYVDGSDAVAPYGLLGLLLGNAPEPAADDESAKDGSRGLAIGGGVGLLLVLGFLTFRRRGGNRAKRER